MLSVVMSLKQMIHMTIKPWLGLLLNVCQRLLSYSKREKHIRRSSTLYLEQGEAEVVLEQDAADAPHVTGMAPTQFWRVGNGKNNVKNLGEAILKLQIKTW